MSKADTARTNYQAAHTELLWRFSERHRVILVYLGATATIFGVALGTGAAAEGVTSRAEILFVIPYLALGGSLLVSQHNILISALLDFCAKEIGPFLEQEEAEAPQFASSKAFRAQARLTLWLRFFGHLLIIGVPCVVALLFNLEYAIWIWPLAALGPLDWLWWLSLLSSMVAVGVLVAVHMRRAAVIARRRLGF